MSVLVTMFEFFSFDFVRNLDLGCRFSELSSNGFVLIFLLVMNDFVVLR